RELVILSQWVALPIFIEQNSREIGMAGEPDAAQVVDLALVPVGAGPKAGEGRHFGKLARLIVLPARQHDLQCEAVAVREAGKMIHDFHVRLEAGLGRLLGIGFKIVHSADAVEEFKLQPRVVAQELAYFYEIGGLDNNKRIETGRVELFG